MLLSTVTILGDRMTLFDACLDHRIEQGIRIIAHTDAQEAVAASKLVRAADPGFLLAKIRQNPRVLPVARDFATLEIVVRTIAADIDHRVY